MPTKCTKKWHSLRKKSNGFITEEIHVLVDEPSPGQLRGTNLEMQTAVGVACADEGMTWQVPAVGVPQLVYTGTFDGDKFPPGIYDLKEDHVTGICTVFNKVGDFEQPFDDDEVWTAEKTT